ncbi:hypothetical protein Tco_0419305 [Tanacetum coccineum]
MERWHGDDDEVMRCDEGGGGRRWGWWVMAWHVGDDVGGGGRLLDWPEVAGDGGGRRKLREKREARLIDVEGWTGQNTDIKDGVSVKYIMGEPLSPDRVFDFPADEPEPHSAYDFFAPGPLPGYVGIPKNHNGWIEADMPLLGKLGVVADEPMDGPMVDEIAEPVVEAKEQVVTPVVGMYEDIAMLFGDEDFEDDDFDGFDEEEVWEVNEDWLMAPTTPPLMPAVPPASVYEVGGSSTAATEGPSFLHSASGLPVPPSVIEDLNTFLGNLEYGHGQLVKKVIQVSDAEVAAGVSIREIGLRVFAIEGQVQVMASPMVHAADRWEHFGAQVEQGQQTATQRDEEIAGFTQQV